VPTINVVHLQPTFEPYTETVSLGQATMTLEHVACAGDLGAMKAHIQQAHGRVQAVALVGVSRELALGNTQVEHTDAAQIFPPSASATGGEIDLPIVDGSGILATMERWAVRLVNEADSTLWAQKRVLMAPGLNHVGLAEALNEYASDIRYADPFVYFSLPPAPGIGSSETLQPAAKRTLPQLADVPYQELFPLPDDQPSERGSRLFNWADVLAGDINFILRHAPANLDFKTVVVPALTANALALLEERQVARVVTLLPALNDTLDHNLALHDPAVFEAVLACLRSGSEPLDETTYLNLLADVQWQPGILQLDSHPATKASFAFVLVPESSAELKQIFDWTSLLPDPMVERFAAYLLPHHLSHMTELSSPATSRRLNGLLFTLGVTPTELIRRDPAFLQKRLVQAATLAERLGAQLLGLDGLPDVIFPAVPSAAKQIKLPLTTGRTLGLVTTLNQAVELQKQLSTAVDEHQPHILVTAATTALGQRAAEWLAQRGLPLTLLAQEPDQLIMLKQRLESIRAKNLISISTSATPALQKASLVIMPERQPTVDWRKCAPGAVVCDLTRPFAYPASYWQARPDVTVIHSTAVRLPGQPTLGYDFELFDGAIPAELAEVVLLALAKESEPFGLTAVPALADMQKVDHLFTHHQLALAAARSYQDNITPAILIQKQTMADDLRRNPEKLAQWQGFTTDSSEPQNELQLSGQVSPDGTETVANPNTKRNRFLTATGLSAAIAAVVAAVAWWWKRRDT
jgi:predicted amino acid dehydrogenase